MTNRQWPASVWRSAGGPTRSISGRDRAESGPRHSGSYGCSDCRRSASSTAKGKSWTAMGLTKPSTHSSGRKETGDIFRVVCGAGGATIPVVSPGQANNGWGQGRKAMKLEQRAGETCSGNPAGTAGQHRITPQHPTMNQARNHQRSVVPNTAYSYCWTHIVRHATTRS